MSGFDSGIRVLHVDDDSQQTKLTKQVLEDIGDDIEVETETRVEAGLARLEVDDIDCVVSDYAMPGMDGLEFLEAVRERDDTLPFILFTGKGSEEIAAVAISAGVSDYLQKGSGMDSYRILINRIENLVAQRRAEKETQQVYSAMETAQEGISLLDEHGRFTYVNQAYADLYGYEPEEMIGEHWELIYPEGEVEQVSEDILPALDERETWHGETTGLRSDGSTFIEDHRLAKRGDGGLVCATHDATEREAGTDDRRTLAAEVLDTSEVGTFVLDSDCEVVLVNEAVEEYFGFDREAVVGADKRALIREELKDRFADPDWFAETVLATYGDDVGTKRFECRVRDTDRTDERWLEHWSQPVESGPYAGGRIEHYTDITERKRREEKLERRRRELEHQNERLDEFASVLSHDLRNPLRTAQMYANILRENGEADAEVVDEVDRALGRMENIIEDVLTLAREGESVEETAPVDLPSVVAETWKGVRADGTTLRTDGDIVVAADEVRLKRLFENLFRNAVEHGGTSVTVRVGPLDDEGGFYIEDDGPGIPADEHADVFEPAYSTTQEGTGFGLSIVRQIADAHGWDAAVTDSAAGGARVEITGVDVVEEDSPSRPDSSGSGTPT